MKFESKFSWLAAVASTGFIACTPASAGPSGAATGGHEGTHGDPSPLRPGTGSGSHFNVPRHEPHLSTRPAEVPRLTQLPGFRNGASQCFTSDDDEYGYGYQSAPTTGSGYGSGGAHKRLYDKSAPAAARAPMPKPAPSKHPGGIGSSATSPSSASPPAAEMADSHRSETKEGRSYAHETPRDYHVDAPRFEERRGEQDWGAAIYLSNDDTMSLSSAQRLIYAVEQFAPIPAEHIRPHEFLNYFSFQSAPVAHDHDFSVQAQIAPNPEDPGSLALGFVVQGRPLSTATRRNANLSYVIDRSGSMQAEGRMEYLKEGLLRSLSELKHGDIVHLNVFDDVPCQLAQNFVVGRDSMAELRSLIDRIQPLGSTNLHGGLEQGYAVADAAYQAGYTNRVIMITDANANTGVTDEELISLVGKHYDQRRIRLSGVGVGRDFNDALLDRLTERGKGAYVFLGSNAEVDAVFGPRFVSLIETVATDVHFRMQLPPSLALKTFYGEEASTNKEQVQAIHYFANTSQMFLSDVVSRSGSLPSSDDLLLTIEYEDPESGQARREDFVWNLGQIAGANANLNKAILVSRFARDIAQIAARTPDTFGYAPGSWYDSAAYSQCQDTRAALSRLAAPIHHDQEVTKVTSLWDTYCSRYHASVPQRPTPAPVPLRNNDYAPPDTWPSASR